MYIYNTMRRDAITQNAESRSEVDGQPGMDLIEN